VRDGAVSRVHCQIAITGEGVVVRDLDSKNGLLLSGARIREAVLPPGVALRLGASELYWVAEGEAQQLPLSKGARFGEALGSSVPMRALFAKLEQAAATDEPVVLHGESGTGKDLLAHGVHQSSARADGPFVVMDCGAVAPALVEAELFGHVRGAFTGAVGTRQGRIEQAHKGTLFLDEVGTMSTALQMKLLRALQEREFERVGDNHTIKVDVRFIAATNSDLAKMVAEGTFREDLYYRLNVIPIQLPPLRERRDDIPLLVTHFLEKFSPDSPMHVAQAAMRGLMAYAWPGNVRQLENAVERAVALSAGRTEVDITDLPQRCRPPLRPRAPRSSSSQRTGWIYPRISLRSNAI
jgi:transcriptional regulator with PAS, ATPase and Fis domain